MKELRAHRAIKRKKTVIGGGRGGKSPRATEPARLTTDSPTWMRVISFKIY